MNRKLWILVFLWAAIIWNGHAQDTVFLPFTEDFEDYTPGGYMDGYGDTLDTLYNHYYFGGWEYCSQGYGTHPVRRWNGPSHHGSFDNAKVSMCYSRHTEEYTSNLAPVCNGALLVTPWFYDRPRQVSFEIINRFSHGDSIELYDQIYVGTVNGALPEVYFIPHFGWGDIPYQVGADFMLSTHTCGFTFVPYASITYERDEWRTITVDVSGLFEGQEPPYRLAFRTIFCGFSDHNWLRDVFLDDISVSAVPYQVSYDTVHYYDTICKGQLYNYHGFVLSSQQTDTVGEMVYSFVEYASGNDTTPTVNMLHLTIHATTLVELYDTIVYGDHYSIADTTISTGGTYNFPIISTEGCDSTVILHLELLPRNDTVVYYDTICEGLPYTSHGLNLPSYSEGEYTFEGDLIATDSTIHYTLHLTVLGNVSVAEERWLFEGDTLIYLGQTITQSGEYTFTLTAANGCDSVITLVVVVETSRIVPDSANICVGDSVLLTASGTDYFHWVSQPPDHTLDSQENANPIMVAPSVSTTYYLLDINGRTVARSRVEVENCGWVWVPNVFTPDAESNNRFGCQTSLDVVSFELTIYNRSGLLVWKSDDINHLWDGSRDGQPLPQGAYVYYYRLKTSVNNRVYTGAGTVTLLR